MSDEQSELNKVFDAMNDDEIVMMVKTRYNDSLTATQYMRQTEWPRYLRTIIQRHETDTRYDYRSRIYVPLVLGQVRTVVPYIMQTIFSSDPVFKLSDITGLKEVEKQALEKLLEKQQNDMGLYEKLADFVQDMCIYGTGIGKVYWETDSRVEQKTRKVQKPKTIELMGLEIPYGTEEVEEDYHEEVFDFDGPVFSHIDPRDFFIDPLATRLDGYWKIHIVHKTFSQFEADNKAADGKLYKNLDQLKTALQATLEKEKQDEIANANKGGGPEAELKARAKQYNAIQAINTGVNVGTTKVRCAEYWSEDNSRVYLVALDHDILLRDAKNPFDHKRHPFVSAVFSKIPGEFWGMGIPKIIYSLQRNVNTITNQRNDNLNLILNRMWKYKLESPIQPDAVISAPGKMFPCDDTAADLVPLDTPDVTQSAYMEVANNKGEAQEALGTKYISGSNPTGSNRTATGVRLNQNAEGASMMGIFKLLEDTALKPMVNMFYKLNFQFNTKENIINFIGPQGEAVTCKISNEAFEEPRHFYVAGIQNILNRDAKVHQMTNYLSVIKGLPPQLLTQINLLEILKRIWTEMGLDDAEKIVATQDMQQQQQQLAAQMQQQQAQSTQLGENMANMQMPGPEQTMGTGNIAGGQQGGPL